MNTDELGGCVSVADQLTRVCAALREKGASLRAACAAAGIAPNRLRRLRFDDAAVSTRIDEARWDGLHARGRRCEFVARTLERESPGKAAWLRARALKCYARAAAISRGRFWFAD